MKIVLIDREELHKIGGIVVYNKRFCNYLTSHGHQVLILRYSRKKPQEKNVFRIPYYIAEARSYVFLPSEKSLEVIKNYLIKFKPGIVYTSCGLSPLDFLLPSLCHELNIPLGGVWHADFNSSKGIYQLLAKSLFLTYLPMCKQLDLMHVFTQKLADFFVARGMDRNKILVLPNGVDHDLYSPGKSDFAAKHHFKTGILFLGRLTTQKNPRVLIDAFLSLNPNPETKLILVGYGEQADLLKDEYKDKRIIFTGIVRDEKIKLSIMRACRIFVLPSRFEGMPLALLEAMSLGLACIASDAGSNQDLLEGSGIVIPVMKMKNRLAPALKQLLENKELSNDFSKKARNSVLKKYSQDKNFQILTKKLQDTVYQYRKKGFPKSPALVLNQKIVSKLKTLLKKTWHLAVDF